jgi:hypothetical protein
MQNEVLVAISAFLSWRYLEIIGFVLCDAPSAQSLLKVVIFVEFDPSFPLAMVYQIVVFSTIYEFL